MRTRIKICCIANEDEARLAIDFGADALGLVGEMPSGPGAIDDERIADISKNIPPPIASFLLTSKQSASDIVEHVKRSGANTVQLVDSLAGGLYMHIKEALPFIKIVQVVHVTGEENVEQASRLSTYVDAILLDSGNPSAAVKILGGTGKVHNWNISRQIVDAVNIPVYLAGGLNSLNVKEAIETVRPFAVDVCSGVRTNGSLDQLKLAAFISAVKSTDYSLS